MIACPVPIKARTAVYSFIAATIETAAQSSRGDLIVSQRLLAQRNLQTTMIYADAHRGRRSCRMRFARSI
jgi:hypothetical protein